MIKSMFHNVADYTSDTIHYTLDTLFDVHFCVFRYLLLYKEQMTRIFQKNRTVKHKSQDLDPCARAL